MMSRLTVCFLICTLCIIVASLSMKDAYTLFGIKFAILLNKSRNSRCVHIISKSETYLERKAKGVRKVVVTHTVLTHDKTPVGKRTKENQ